jgi:hypothetical protein
MISVARSVQSWRVQIIRDHPEGCKECVQESFDILEFVARTNIRRHRDLENP